MARVRADKEREAKDGHDGTWVAHPGLVAVAKAIFDAQMKGPNQLGVLRGDVSITREDLLRVPEGSRTEDGLRHNVRVGVRYLEAWLRGQGCVPLFHLMEDAATAEISRAQVWQQMRHKLINIEKLDQVMREELADANGGMFSEAEDALPRALDLRALRRIPHRSRLPTTAGHREVTKPFTHHPTHTTRLHPGAAIGAVLSPHQERAMTEHAKQNMTPGDIHAKRFDGITRPYSKADVEKLRGSVKIEHTLARLGAMRLWELLNTREYINALGAMTGGQAVQMVRAGLEALYISVGRSRLTRTPRARCTPTSRCTRSDSVPNLVKRINSSLRRAIRSITPKERRTVTGSSR